MTFRAALKSALVSGVKMFAISSVAAATTAITVFQTRIFRNDGSLDFHTALATASTAFLIAFATSVLHLLERSLGPSLEPPKQTPPSTAKT